MTAKEFWFYLKKDQSNFKKKILAFSVIAAVTAGIFTGVLAYINGQGSLLAITENEINREKEFISQHRKEIEQFRQEHGNFTELAPKNEIEKIQNELIQKTKDYRLDVTSIQTIQTADSQAIEFEMGFAGTWEESVKYIRQLQERPNLISVLSCIMAPKQNAANLIETRLKYKIYTE